MWEAEKSREKKNHIFPSRTPKCQKFPDLQMSRNYQKFLTKATPKKKKSPGTKWHFETENQNKQKLALFEVT